VEDKGSRGQLVLIGYDKEIVERIGPEYGLPDIKDIIMIPGSHGQQGQIVSEPGWDELVKAVMDCKSRVDAFGVAEYWGIRNPDFERAAKEIIRKSTGLPVVCAHETTMEVNSLRRAATVLLNARLIPLTDELIKAVKAGLREMGVKSPLMIVRGDGSLMSEEFAREHPVETLLSGPAASVVGGMKLSGKENCIIVDMGGTTSDIAVARHGRPALVKEGVEIGEWRTGTHAIELKTIGLGGDSLVSFNRAEKLIIGPQRAVPLSWLGYRWPCVVKELRRIYGTGRKSSISLGEFFIFLKEPAGVKNAYFTAEEERIVDVLKEEPRSIEDLAHAVGTKPYFINTQRLESLGLIARAGFTPTDVMHINGEFSAWDVECARLGGEILAQRLGFSLKEMMVCINHIMVKRLFSAIIQYLLERNWKRSEKQKINDIAKIVDVSFDNPYDEIKSFFTTSMPIVGIGAPVHLYLEPVARALGTQAIVPSEAGVANAVGAITGSIISEEMVFIRPNYDVSGITGYSCHSSRNYFEAKDYNAALFWAKQEAVKNAKEQAAMMGALDVNIEMQSYDRRGDTKEGREVLLLETVVTARGVGRVFSFKDMN
jgi:N-methylhydantoinase A/oxoprolinase/acetone carboxylase beta subunit